MENRGGLGRGRRGVPGVNLGSPWGSSVPGKASGGSLGLFGEPLRDPGGSWSSLGSVGEVRWVSLGPSFTAPGTFGNHSKTIGFHCISINLEDLGGIGRGGRGVPGANLGSPWGFLVPGKALGGLLGIFGRSLGDPGGSQGSLGTAGEVLWVSPGPCFTARGSF